jgi:hypothetical protein
LRRSAGAESSDRDSTLETRFDGRAPARQRKDVKNFPPVDFAATPFGNDAVTGANGAIACTSRAYTTFCDVQKTLVASAFSRCRRFP